MFIQKEEVHPTVQFIKNEYKVTWKEIGKILSDKMSTLGYEVHLSAANVRNFATGRSAAWWFWARISEIVMGIWNSERETASTPAELRNIDLKFSALFSEDLKSTYGFWYEVKKMSKEERNNCKAIEHGLALSNSIFNENEAFFGADFPKIPLRAAS
jgi:hypothetical protein